jgi:hypothetical protein
MEVDLIAFGDWKTVVAQVKHNLHTWNKEKRKHWWMNIQHNCTLDTYAKKSRSYAATDV